MKTFSKGDVLVDVKTGSRSTISAPTERRGHYELEGVPGTTNVGFLFDRGDLMVAADYDRCAKTYGSSFFAR